VMQRLLHEPTLRLKSADDIGGHGRQQLLRELFGLEEGLPPADRAPAPESADNVRPLKRRA
jgi:glutamyl-tRNA reductase